MVPSISVVIPNAERPLPVLRAVRSALAQTVTAIEVIVVVDGPGQATMQALTTVDDLRLRVIALPSRQGSAAARNAGIDAARAPWIGMLDDDDEWLPEKLDLQRRAAQHSNAPEPIISCRLVRRSRSADVVLPRRTPAPGEPMSEYLFRRSRLSGGEGLMPSSTLFASRSLMRRVPFRSGIQKHDDLDWLLRAAAGGGSPVFVATADPLVVWHQEGALKTASGRNDWRFSFSWIRECRSLVTPRAYASFLLTWVSDIAVKQGDRAAFWPLLTEAFRNGRPSAIDGIVFSSIWLLPLERRRRLAASLTSWLAARETRAWTRAG